MRTAGLVLLAVVLTLAGFAGGWLVASSRSADSLHRVIAMQWGDGRYGPAFYGAHVYLLPAGTEYEVHARVLVGRGNDYEHDLGLIGRAATPEDAVKHFGVIQWSPDGLHIGDGQSFPVFLERAKLEAHR